MPNKTTPAEAVVNKIKADQTQKTHKSLIYLLLFSLIIAFLIIVYLMISNANNDSANLQINPTLTPSTVVSNTTKPTATAIPYTMLPSNLFAANYNQVKKLTRDYFTIDYVSINDSFRQYKDLFFIGSYPLIYVFNQQGEYSFVLNKTDCRSGFEINEDSIFISCLSGINDPDWGEELEIREYSLVSGKLLNTWNTSNGLVSGFNLRLVMYDGDLWISTFKGVSRIDMTTKQVKSWDKPIGTGNAVSVILYADQKAGLFGTVTASNLSEGGIVKWDKASQDWLAYPRSSFANVTNRIDVNLFHFDDDKASFFYDNTDYTKHYKTQFDGTKWNIVATYNNFETFETATDAARQKVFTSNQVQFDDQTMTVFWLKDSNKTKLQFPFYEVLGHITIDKTAYLVFANAIYQTDGDTLNLIKKTEITPKLDISEITMTVDQTASLYDQQTNAIYYLLTKVCPGDCEPTFKQIAQIVKYDLADNTVNVYAVDEDFFKKNMYLPKLSVKGQNLLITNNDGTEEIIISGIVK